MNRLKNKPKKGAIARLKERKDYNSFKFSREPIDLFFPLLCHYSLKTELTIKPSSNE